MMSGQEFSFPMGTVVGFHGLRGEVKVRPSTNSPEILIDVSVVLAMVGKEKLQLTVDSLRLDKKLLFVTFEDHEDRTSVEYLSGANLFVNEAELAPLEEEEFWIKDLVGLDVFTTDGNKVGVVKDIINAANDLIEIQPQGAPPEKTILVPFVKDLVPLVNLKQRRIEVREIPGLLEPQ